MRNFSAFVRDLRACFAVARELERIDRPGPTASKASEAGE
jgi:hypothetical protein